MKKHLLTAAAALTCMFAAISVSSGQTAVFSYNDGVGTANAGTYTPGSSFTFSISLAFTAGGNIANLEGLSYWFEQQNLNAPFNFSITLRDVTGSQFTDLQTSGLTYPQALAAQETKDLGALLPTTPGLGNNSYFIANITVSIAPTAAPGTYVIENTTSGGKTSVITDDQGHTFAIPQATYTITIVPEPTSLALLAVGLVVLGIFVYRRRVSSH
jgi:PEP-CTERM motif